MIIYIYIYIKHDNGQELQKTLRFLMTEHKVILTKKNKINLSPDTIICNQ